MTAPTAAPTSADLTPARLPAAVRAITTDRWRHTWADLFEHLTCLEAEELAAFIACAYGVETAVRCLEAHGCTDEPITPDGPETCDEHGTGSAWAALCPHHQRAYVAALREALAPQQLEIVEVVDPDAGTALDVFVDGEPVTDYGLHIIDPGRGYTRDVWDRAHADALNATAHEKVRANLDMAYRIHADSEYITD